MDKNFIKLYRQAFDDSFSTPEMLDDLKAELTFTPHVVVQNRVLMRLVFELIVTFAAMLNAYSIVNGNVSFDLGGDVNWEKVSILLSIAGFSFLLFLIELIYRYVKLKKNRA